MAAVLREAFCPVAEREKQIAHEHNLLLIVRNGADNPAAAKQAATELMCSYVSVAGIADDETRAVIECGMQHVASIVARAGLGKGGRTWVEPLDYFATIATFKSRGGRPPKIRIDNRLELRAAHGDWISCSEALSYLETREGDKERTRTTIPIDQRAKNMSAVESHLESYVQSIYPAYSRNECAQFVRDSFPHWPWSDGKRPFAYD